MTTHNDAGPTQTQIDAWVDEFSKRTYDRREFLIDYIARRAAEWGREQAIKAVQNCPNTHSDQRERIVKAIRKGET